MNPFNTQSLDIQEKQSQQLIRLLNLNQSAQESGEVDDECVWKIIVFDKHCQDILSPLFKVGNLRDENITLHLNLQSNREKLHEVKVIYFIEPTEENLLKINEDFAKDLYDNVYINFVYQVSDDYLNRIATAVAKYNGLHKIKQVFQHNLSLVSLNNNLFHLNIQSIYSKIRLAQGEELDALYDLITMGLFSVCRVSKVVPVFYYQNEHGAEIVKRIQVI